MTREEAKELFRQDKDTYGKPRKIMTKIDKIYDDFEYRTCNDCKYKHIVSSYRVECRCDDSMIDLLADYKDAPLLDFACKYFERSK